MQCLLLLNRNCALRLHTNKGGQKVKCFIEETWLNLIFKAFAGIVLMHLTIYYLSVNIKF